MNTKKIPTRARAGNLARSIARVAHREWFSDRFGYYEDQRWPDVLCVFDNEPGPGYVRLRSQFIAALEQRGVELIAFAVHGDDACPDYTAVWVLNRNGAAVAEIRRLLLGLRSMVRSGKAPLFSITGGR